MAIIEGRWDCTQCQNVGIPGHFKECPECHDPRDQVNSPEEGVYFPNLDEVTDPAILSQAGHGPDWNCGHCGVANRGDTKICRECGRALDSDDIVMRRKRYVEGRWAEGVPLSGPVESADDIIENELAHATRVLEGRGERPRVLDDRVFSMDDLPRSGALADRVAGYRRDLEDADEPGPLAPIIRMARDHSHRLRIASVVLATLVLVSGAGLAAWFAFSTEPVTLTITGLTWERRVGIEQQQTFTEEGWSIPAFV